MSLEYVIVVFPRSPQAAETRSFYVDDYYLEPFGTTNKVLQIEGGTHKFTLDGPDDVTPKSITKVVIDTNSTNPMQIVFDRNPEATDL